MVVGVEDFVAPYPFDIHITFHRSTRGRGPVPWANTVRSRRQGVNFHVDPRHSLKELKADWTAAHELSHLLIPYLGKRNAWFAEGFASYMQYQVMHSMGTITDQEMQTRYQEKIERAATRYDMDDMPFTEAAGELVARRDYPTMYWGGALYFLQVDTNLRRQSQSVPAVLREFLECCRMRVDRMNALVSELDRLSGSELFSKQIETMRTSPGFPDESDIWSGT